MNEFPEGNVQGNGERNIVRPLQPKRKKKLSSLNDLDKIPMPVEIEKSNRAKKMEIDKGKISFPKTNFSDFKTSKIFMSFLSLSILSLLFIFIFLAIILSTLKSIEVKNMSAYKNIDISTTPVDADIYLNNYYIGLSPLSLNNLNLNESLTIRIRKEGYKEETLVVDKTNVQNSYDLVLNSDSSQNKKISWNDFGIILNVPSTYTESLTLEKATCKEVKQYAVDSTRCKTDNDILNYNSKILSFSDAEGKKYTMTVKVPTNSNNCKITTTKCSSAKKIDNIKFLGESVNVYEAEKDGNIVIFLDPIIKVKGVDYNSFYLEFNGSADYKKILDMISKNA